jgi:hypothetical protein
MEFNTVRVLVIDSTMLDSAIELFKSPQFDTIVVNNVYESDVAIARALVN